MEKEGGALIECNETIEESRSCNLNIIQKRLWYQKSLHIDGSATIPCNFTVYSQFDALSFVEYDSAFSEDEKQQAKVLKISCNLNNAACKLKLRDYKQAVKLCTKVLDADSKNVKALYRRAQAYIQLVDLDLAEMDIKKALEIDPDNR
ncbi:FKBP-type peptidyl-prolyl cis-trans isomerase domain-containing protein [Tanacetum coccineum]|uniref:peptidylprolyl isomerase n=1 Tax=Tanacetum coccineum TaxID=301880 RepID=A0ABQ5DMY3_9ASTR